MKNGPLFFLGLFAALTLSFGGIVLGSHAQLGGLAPYFDDNEGKSFPDRTPGIAARGQIVYRELGCAACHTQQVRRPGFGSDQGRGWGERQSVARDFIFQSTPQLGSARIGPDLTNLAGRKPTPLDAADLSQLLYSGVLPPAKVVTHPQYKFIFDDQLVVGEKSSKALKLSGALAPAADHMIVPTPRAQALIAYLLSLNTVYDYPESRPVPAVAAKKEGEHK